MACGCPEKRTVPVSSVRLKAINDPRKSEWGMSEENPEFDLAKMIGELENYLEFPPQSILSIFAHTSEEWVYVLKIASMIETVLKSALLLRMRPTQSLGFGFGLRSSRKLGACAHARRWHCCLARAWFQDSSSR